MKDKIFYDLKLIVSSVKKNQNLSKYNSFKIKTKAEYFVTPESLTELRTLLEYLKKNKIQHYILGGGTNVLLSDDFVPGVMVYMDKFNRMESFGNKITFGSGVVVNDAAIYAQKLGLSGLEWAYGLPGTIGGAVFMNARCYGSEMAEIIDSVRYLDDEFTFHEKKRIELHFDYKLSPFQDGKKIITHVTFNLKQGNKNEIKKTMNANLKDRKDRKQFDYPSAGCIFMNDRKLGMPTGQLIESVGLKGQKEGGAEVSLSHANFIINKHNASARDVFVLMRRVQANVKEKKGATIKPELRLIGKW